VIAAVESMASGAGFSLAMACDFIVSGSSAQFSMPLIRDGLTPDSGIWFLAQAVSRQMALEILMEGKPFSASRLHQLGLVNRLADDGNALQTALDWVDEIAALPGSAIEKIKSLVRETPAHSMTQFSEIEKQYFLESLHWRENPENPANASEKKKY
jgi:enoyl-CoA hydratase/carnithine racemase